MEGQLQKELSKIIKKERSQKRITRYVSRVGKWFLYVLPIILVIITLLTIFKILLLDFIVIVVFYLVLAVYGINSILLLLGARMTISSLEMRLDFERRRGRPLDSLEGFDTLYHNVKRVVYLLYVIAILCIVALILFVTMLVLGFFEIGYAAIGFALFGFGLALLVRSLKLNIHDVNGLQDFYKPSSHALFLDNFFSEVFSNHLEPVSYLKWDEYLSGINKILNPMYIERTKAQEAGELPITFAIENLLFLYYLEYQNVLTKEQFVSELKEIVNVDSEKFDVDKGLEVGGTWYFSLADIYKIFEYIKYYTPSFFSIIDRIQLELSDNIERISKDPIYMDSSCQEIVYKDGELHLLIFLFNNSEEAKQYSIRIVAPGFEPREINLDLQVEGRGSFTIPAKSIPLISSGETDIVGVLSSMLENGDTTWISLEPRKLGEQTIQIFLVSDQGTIIEGRTRSIKVSKNIIGQLKKLTSFGSIVGGVATPLSRVFLSGGFGT
ncbi:MAG: hypothetical protein GF353_00005 [Candidatus Lokiarchaeota archaeon]|nr:hypothetical protein [Candidatus Lokiarchaeota archaeon]